MEKNTNFYPQIILKASKDPEFRKKLISNPAETLREEGMEIPEGVNITVCEQKENQHFLFLPAKPEGKLSSEELQAIAAGGGTLDLESFFRDTPGMTYHPDNVDYGAEVGLRSKILPSKK